MSVIRRENHSQSTIGFSIVSALEGQLKNLTIFAFPYALDKMLNGRDLPLCLHDTWM